MGEKFKIVGGPTKKEKTGKPHDGIALSEENSEEKKWYGVDEKAAKFLSNFKMGDTVEVNIEGGLVKFIKKVGGSPTPPQSSNTSYDKPSKPPYVDNSKGQAFGLSCHLALRFIGIAGLTEEEDYLTKYKEMVRKFYKINEGLKEELVN